MNKKDNQERVSNRLRVSQRNVKGISTKVQESKRPTIEVLYASEDTPRLVQHGDWIDLAVDEDVDLKRKGDMQHVSLGVAMKLPDGYEAIIAERSSTHKKKGVDLANGIGIIDNAYQGNDDVWCAELVANRSRVHIDRGERVLQFRIVPSMSRLVPDLQINEVEQLEGVNRGGFGSTGR